MSCYLLFSCSCKNHTVLCFAFSAAFHLCVVMPLCLLMMSCSGSSSCGCIWVLFLKFCATFMPVWNQHTLHFTFTGYQEQCSLLLEVWKQMSAIRWNCCLLFDLVFQILEDGRTVILTILETHFWLFRTSPVVAMLDLCLLAFSLPQSQLASLPPPSNNPRCC